MLRPAKTGVFSQVQMYLKSQRSHGPGPCDEQPVGVPVGNWSRGKPCQRVATDIPVHSPKCASSVLETRGPLGAPKMTWRAPWRGNAKTLKFHFFGFEKQE